MLSWLLAALGVVGLLAFDAPFLSYYNPLKRYYP
jgi:hypothetical protein